MKKISAIKRILRGYAALLGTALACLAPALAQGQQFDIVGLKLGMTEPEVIAALKAHDPTLKITSQQSSYTYSDGVRQFQTTPFLSRIEASQTKHDPMETLYPAKITIWLTPPPQAGRVWGIERKEYLSQKNPPTVSQYAAALIKKYGNATVASRDNMALSWDFPAGKPNCILQVPNQPGSPAYRPSSSDDLGFMLNLWQQRKLITAKDLSTCASRLHYLLGTNGDVISSFQAIMFDVGLYSAASDAANREVKALEDKARKAREGKGQTPKL